MEVPIVICNFNRLDCLRKQVDCFERRGWKDITILDMSSTWGPLLDWYKTCGHRVVTLPNEGPYYWWRTEEYERVKGGYYVYTDSDVILPDTCPPNVLDKFVAILSETIFYGWGKVGPILRTHDIPDSFPFKANALKSDGVSANRDIFRYIGPGVRVGLIDTTFSMYAPGRTFETASPRADISPCVCLVTEAPYEAIHLPWYLDFTKLTDEDKNYLETAGRWSMNSQNVRGSGGTI